MMSLDLDQCCRRTQVKHKVTHNVKHNAARAGSLPQRSNQGMSYDRRYFQENSARLVV
jgi:hypothetical protein